MPNQVIKIEDIETQDIWEVEVKSGPEDKFVDFINDHPDGIASLSD